LTNLAVRCGETVIHTVHSLLRFDLAIICFADRCPQWGGRAYDPDPCEQSSWWSNDARDKEHFTVQCVRGCVRGLSVSDYTAHLPSAGGHRQWAVHARGASP